MYFDVFSIIVILTYQCLMLYSSSVGKEAVLSTTEKPSGIDDCSFPLPSKDDDETPKASILHYSARSMGLRTRKGYVNVKHRSFMKLSCKKGQIISISEDHKRITVRCIRKQYVEYLGKIHKFSDIKCIGDPIKTIIVPRKNKTESAISTESEISTESQISTESESNENSIEETKL